MANELNISVQALFEKGGQRKEFRIPLLEVDVAGDQASYISQAIGTSEEALDLAEIVTGGFFFAINRSTESAEIITLKIATGETAAFTLNIGEFVCGRLHASAVPTAISASGTPILDMLVIEA